MKQDRDVVICLKVALTFRVPSESADEAEDLAHELADAFTRKATELPGFRVMEELDRAINSVRPVVPVRTVAHARDIGDGVVADDWTDE